MKKLILLVTLVISCMTCFAQTVCDSVSIDKVFYDPFYDTVIRVNASNYSQTLIGYPRFTLMTTGATVAEEQMDKFGLIQESFHALSLRPGKPSQNSFPGFLLLEGTDSLTCIFEQDFSLCPDTCKMIYPHVGYFGPTQISGTLNWTIERSNGQVVASGQLIIDANNPSDRDSACLMPGAYTFKINGSLTPGENPYFSILTKESSYFQTPYDGNGFNIPFHFFKRCADPTGILVRQPQPDAPFNVYAATQTIHVISQADEADARVYVFTADGRSVYEGNLSGNHTTVGLSHVSTGIYLVRISSRHGFVHKKVLIGTY